MEQGEEKRRGTFEAFFEMRLDTGRILRFGKNLEHFVVGQEEEAREEESLLLEIRVQAFVDAVQKAVAVLQLLQQSRKCCCHHHCWIAHRVAHNVLSIRKYLFLN